MATYEVCVDWNNDGDFVDVTEDITIDVKWLTYERGVEAELERAATGTLTLAVRNETGKYSPEYTGSVLSPNLLPGRPVRVRVVHDAVTYTVFTGYIEKITPFPKEKTCEIFCTDGMDRLNRVPIEAPRRGAAAGIIIGKGTATKVSGVALTFAPGPPPTITRASGSFITDGYQPDMFVLVRAGPLGLDELNVSVHKIASAASSVTALVLTLTSNSVLAAEAATDPTLEQFGILIGILDEAGWPETKRSLDAGVDTLDLWWAHREKALDAIAKLMQAERSLAYVKGDGTFVYEDRHHRLKTGLGGAADHIASQGTFSNTMTEMEYEFSARTVRNIAQVTGHKRAAAALPATVLWGTRDTPRIEPNKALTIWAHLEQPATAIVSPVGGTDYGISATAAGVDSAALRANVAAVFTVYGQSVKMTFTSTNTQDVYIVNGSAPGTPAMSLIIRGQEYEDDEVFAKEEDAASQVAYGDRAIEIDNPFMGNFNSLQAYAEWLVSRYKNPQPDALQMHLLNSTSALWTQILAREISDRITLTVTDLGVSAKDYYINKMHHEMSEGGSIHKATWWLERVDETKYWLLEIAGYGELEQTTKVGF